SDTPFTQTIDKVQLPAEQIEHITDGLVNSLNSEDEKLLESTHGVLTELIDKSLANNDISIIKSIIVAGGDNDKLVQVQKLINDNNLIDKINTSKIEDNIKTSLVEKLNEIKEKEYIPDKPELFTDSKLSEPQIIERDGIKYHLYAPEGVDPNAELPVLVYLHGSGEVGNYINRFNGVSEQNPYGTVGPGKIMSEWNLSNFNGYIICPQLPSGNWQSANVEKELRNILTEFSSEHKVNSDKIAIAGHSLGGMGTEYMAIHMGDVFSKAAVLSGYNIGGTKSEIPIRGYTASRGDGDAYTYTVGKFVEKYGKENSFVVESAGHGPLPGDALRLDSDGNGKSDLIEWLFSDE
ncbi:MAG: hypothetical protein E7Z90_06870, partial [Cyanobacteria bacterium SIG29]|nr:hypothetical protein [Cyanobacteria bacterium SIG29]